MKAALLGTVALEVVAAGTVRVRAHHPHQAFYDQCTTLTIEGQIERVEWKNPHVLIDIQSGDGKSYRAEWTSAAILGQMSVAPPKVGDQVVVRANPMRDEAAIRAKYPDFKPGPPEKPVVDLRQIRRASDGWNWGTSEPLSPPDCGRK